jgi:thiol-disulfide isomerase/thioredoxin
MREKLTLTILCALLVLVASPAPAREGIDGDEISIKLKGVDGKTYDVQKMRGEVVLVSFGATWCVPCAWELAVIEELRQEYQGKPVKFLWVSIESEGEVSNALLRHYAKSQKLSIPVLRDPTRTVFAQFSDRLRIPLVVFFDRQGRFAAPAHRGMSSEPIEYKMLVRSRLNALLAAQDL